MQRVLGKPWNELLGRVRFLFKSIYPAAKYVV